MSLIAKFVDLKSAFWLVIGGWLIALLCGLNFINAQAAEMTNVFNPKPPAAEQVADNR